MGKVVDGKLYFRDRLHRVFFKPAFGGQTFGFGQLSPVAALMVTDMVHAKSGRPLLSIDDASQVYEEIMNPDSSLLYVAANIRVSIDMYKRIAGMDISKNPGRHGDALQSRRCGDPGPGTQGDQRRAREEGPAATLPARELLRLAGQRPRSGAAQAGFIGSPPARASGAPGRRERRRRRGAGRPRRSRRRAIGTRATGANRAPTGGAPRVRTRRCRWCCPCR